MVSGTQLEISHADILAKVAVAAELAWVGAVVVVAVVAEGWRCFECTHCRRIGG